jgi:hypothetical protein
MKRRSRWVVVGLLCVSGAIGCVQLPTRGLFTRRPQPDAFDAALTDEPDDSVREDDATTFADSSQNVPRDSNATDSSGGLFGVSSDVASSSRSLAVEAPPPQQRSATALLSAESLPPNRFTPSGHVRELQPERPQSPIELASGLVTPGRLDTNGGIVTADFAQSSAGGYASDMELAAGQQRTTNTANGAANPWDRFRNLTNNLEPTANRPEQPLASERPGSANLPMGNPIPSWSHSATPAVATNGLSENPNAPELWPQAPGAVGTNGATAPQNVQWVNAERPAINNPMHPALAFPTQPNAPVFVPAANSPLNIGQPQGAPVVVAPFASSAELERLITQTTVEAAALIPGDNDVARQLYLRKHVQLRLLHLMSGQMDRALQPVPGIDPADQEFWQQMFWGMANYFDTQGMPDSSERATQTIAQLKSAATRLQEKARLELHNVAFCYKISGFGNYQRFKRDEFTPGQPVLLYAEVGNFKSELISEGQFRTLLKSTLEIVEGGPAGRVVETLPLAPSEDRCRNQRRDYYHSYEFSIPQSCNPGPHTLRLRVEDQLGKKLAVTALNFTVQ